MSRLLGHRPSPAMVVAMLALFISLAGTGYAAIKLPANSVGAKQLKANAVTSKKIKHGAVDGSKVRANSLTGTNINERSLGKVPTAVSADKANSTVNAELANHALRADSAATAGTATALASVAYRADTSAGAVTVPACTGACGPNEVGTAFAIATCPAGTVAIGGGGVTGDPGVELSGSFPTTVGSGPGPDAWEVDVDNWRSTTSEVDYFVVCTAATTVDNP
jgi:hypothetical protein